MQFQFRYIAKNEQAGKVNIQTQDLGMLFDRIVFLPRPIHKLICIVIDL
jgi:hypothetical protein